MNDGYVLEVVTRDEAFAAEERRAWDAYAAAAMWTAPSEGAEYADALLAERRKRFPPPADK